MVQDFQSIKLLLFNDKGKGVLFMILGIPSYIVIELLIYCIARSPALSVDLLFISAETNYEGGSPSF